MSPDLLERRIQINNEADVMRITIITRQLLAPLCRESEASLISTVTSEIATNLVRYALGGFIYIAIDRQQRWVCIESNDEGPGIQDISLAMQEGHSTGRGLGAGLPAIQRIMDSMHIENKPTGGLKLEARCKLKTLPN